MVTVYAMDVYGNHIVRLQRSTSWLIGDILYKKYHGSLTYNMFLHDASYNTIELPKHMVLSPK